MTEIPAPAFTFDIMDWIARGTAARRSVVIHNNPALVAEYEALERELQAAEATTDRTMDDPSPASIEARMTDLYERWQASRAVWTVQALSDETLREIAAAHPMPDRPADPPADADEDTKAAHAAALKAWQPEWSAASDERNFAMIAAAVVSVETPQGTATSVPVEAIRALRRRPHGAVQTEHLIQAVRQATAGDSEIPAPKSVRPSETDPA